jgi:hypothetical protein
MNDKQFGILMILLSPIVYLMKLIDWLNGKAKE